MLTPQKNPYKMTIQFPPLRCDVGSTPSSAEVVFDVLRDPWGRGRNPLVEIIPGLRWEGKNLKNDRKLPCQVIQSDLFGMVKWPFQGLSDL